MADPAAAPDANPLDQFNSELPVGAPPPAKTAPAKAPEPEVNPLARFNSERPYDEPAPTTAAGTFLRGAERSVIPAIGSLPAIGAGVELGGALGALGGPAAPITAPAGALLGGLGGALLGSTAISKAQDWALSKLPDSWREAIGLDERQEKLDQGEHPIASFLGGIAPFALTMRPGGLGKVALPENATALQRIMAHPATARIFGGTAMGGIELGQEAAEGEHPDWTKVAISTGFGLVFNKPTRIGEALTETGARPARTVMGVPHPTVAQANDANVAGPGVTEDVHQGAHERDPAAAMTAQQAVREEQAVMGAPLPERNVAETARKHAPEAFALWDDLHSREAMLRQWDRGPETVPHIAEHLRDTREQIAELAPEIQGAYRRAAEALGTPTVAPAEGAGEFKTMAEMLAARGGGEAAPARPVEAAGEAPAAPPAKPIAEQRAAIAADVERQLLAAGYDPAWSTATAQIQASRYAARAQRLGLEPEPLYRQSAPAITGRRGAPPPPTTPGAPAPPPPTPGAPTLAPIDATHDVAEGANSAKEPGGPIAVDRHIPELSPTLKDDQGNPVNLHNMLRLHEETEAEWMRRGLSYKRAHEMATEAERTLAKRTGIDFDAYTREIDGFLSETEHEKVANPPPFELHVKPEEAIGHHKSENKQPPKQKPEAFAGIIAQHEKSGMIENAEAYRDAAKKRRERGAGTIRVYTSAAEQARDLGLTVKEANAQRAEHEAIEGKRFEEALAADGITPEEVSKEARETAIEKMITGMEPREALEFATAKLEHEARVDDEAASATKDIISLEEEYHDLHGEVPRHPGEHVAGTGEEIPKQGAQEAVGLGEPAREAGEARSIEELAEYFQRRGTPRDLNAEREAASPKTVKLKDGTEAVLQTSTGDRGQRHFEAHSKDGEPLGFVTFDENGDGTWTASSAVTNEPYRRKGVATALYDYAEAEGLRLVPEGQPGSGRSHKISPEARAFWANRQKPMDIGPQGKPQLVLPGADRITQAELVQRRANAPLKPTVAQKPMDEGLFGDSAAQKELFQQAPVYYSMVARTIEGAKQEKASGEQWLAFLKNQQGVKAEEMEWLGLPDWLKEQKGAVTKQEIADYVRANAIEVKEVEKGKNLVLGMDAAKGLLTAIEEKADNPRQAHELYNAAVDGDATAIGEIEGLGVPDHLIAPFRDRVPGGPAKFGPPNYTGQGAPLPGGENYRELLLTLPIKDERKFVVPPGATLEQIRRNAEPSAAGAFRSSHWDEPNVLAHVRFDDRVVDGKKTLHVAEVQSDWHQKGRKEGYATGENAAALRQARDAAQVEHMQNRARLVRAIREHVSNDALANDLVDKIETSAGIAFQGGSLETPADIERFLARYEPSDRGAIGNFVQTKIAYERSALAVYRAGQGVPDAPFKTTWPELALKRMIRYAAEHGYGRLSWDTGDTNAERYDLSKQVSRVAYVNGTLSAWDHDARQIMAHSDVKPEQLPDYIGKEAADKLLATEPKKPPLLADVERKNLTIEQDEHQYIVRNKDGREVKIGKGTVDNEDEARDYAVRYLNKTANEINLARVNEYGRIGPTHELSGLDLKVGGEGMRGFYDKMLPAAASKLVKKFGAKVEDGTMLVPQSREATIPDRPKPVHTIDITPQLRDAAVGQGFPLFQTRMGKVTFREGQRPVITLFKNADASTAIHELGHTYLEELMDDADHPAAPADLKADAATVLDWLKVSSAGRIEAKHHEKFARGFEQYMREGVAPSQELASVFAKFRDWLLRIYQSVRDLVRRPENEINPDVRAVFDRMLSTAPQHTVVAPEVAKRPTLQDIHESDAIETEPHEAEPVMDRVVAEADRQEVEPPPEVANEIAEAEAKRADAAANEPSGEAGPGGTEGGEVPGTSERPGIEPPGGAVGAEPSAKLPGGGAARAEGAGVSGPERPGNAADLSAGLGDKPLAPRASPILGAAESPFIDRAGNIRLDTLTTREDVRDAIRAAATENQDFIGDRRGVITDGQVMDLANDIGMAGAEAMLKQRLTGQAFNAEQITAARLLLRQSATDVSAAMKKAASGTDEDVMAYAQAKDRHQLIQAQIAGITAEAGRALRAFRDITGAGEEGRNLDLFIRQATGKTLFQLRREAQLGAQLDTPQQVSKFMQDAQKRTFGRMLLEYWTNGLISGLATHITYAVGNKILALQKAGPETAAAALVGSIRKAMGREGETVRIGEVAAQFKALPRGFAPAMKAAMDAFRTGVTTALPGEHEANLLPFQEYAPLGQPAAMDEAAKLHDAFTAAFGIIQGVRDGFRAGGGIAAEAPMVGLRYSHLGVIPDVEIAGMNFLPVGTAVRLPGRFIAAIHSFYRATNYSMDKAAIAYRTAANEGLTGHAFDARVGDLMQNPPDTMMEQARGTATELTLMGQGGELTRRLSAFVNTPIAGFPIFKFIDPFVKISSAIIKQSLVERTPLGILSPEIRADLMGKNGNVAQDTATARMMVGTAYALAIGGLAAEGYISGSGPSDSRQAAIWRLAGNQAHSVRVGDLWYDVHRLGPMGMLMGVAADLYEVAHKASEGDMLTAASTLQHAITQNILDESFMRGPSDLIKAIDDPGRYGEAYIRNTLSSFVPYSVGMAQIARASDPYSRQARSVLDAIKAKVPGLSDSLLPRRDIWGEPMPSREALLAAGVTAIYETRMSRDPVNLAMLELGLHPGAVERKIRGVQLTDDQYDDFQRIAGRMTKMRLDAIVQSPDFRAWPNHIKGTVISEVLKQSREAARGMLMMKYPQIVQDAVKARLDKLKD